VHQRELAPSWKILTALLVVLFAACSDNDKAPPPAVSAGPTGKGVYLGGDFALARAVTGHRVHVVAQKIECSKCHTATETSMGPPPKPEKCAACHEKEAKLEHAETEAEKRFGAGVKADCTTCHAFKFEGKDQADAHKRAEALLAPVDGGTGLTGMHGIEQFGPGDCKRCHETKQGDTPAVVSHLTQVCLACHKPHEDETPKSAPCSDCHKDIQTTHAAQGKSIQEMCTTCHQNEHAPASEAAATCVECHSKEKPIIPETALFANGHTECTNCHEPHDFEQKEAATCTSCHSGVHVIGGSKIPAHNTCTNCHSPHNVRGTPAAACSNCHKELHPKHPTFGPGGSCVGCHDPHPAQVTAGTVGAAECSSCHKMASSDHAFHKGQACESCHKPHNFELELASVSTCKLCHAQRVQQVSVNAGHQACTQCHQGLPHNPEDATVGCEKCHKTEHAKLNAGHGKCTQCHEPHSGSQATACSSCHKEEHRTAPQGHQACLNCHEPHGGVMQKACPSCHATEAKTPHGQVASGCLSCHRPHGPSGPNGPGGVATVPACTSCHKVASLPGLHAQTKHQTCTTCHSGHQAVPGTTRQVCMSCHKNKESHFPNAQVCSSCHLFTGTR
jgi:hypothetical protein